MIRVTRVGKMFTVELGAPWSLTRAEATDLRDALTRELEEAPVLVEDIPTRRETPISIAAVRDTDPAPPRRPSSGKLSAVVGRIFDEAKPPKDPRSE